MRIDIDLTKSTDEKGFWIIRDGERGLIRLTREEVQVLADLTAAHRSKP